jgi:hypothetical protein
MTARRWRRSAGVAGVAIALVLAAACSGPRSGASITGDVSGCAAVLPLANDIVHGEGRLVLIRRISKGDVERLSRQLGVTPAPLRRHAGSPGPHHPVRSRWSKACLIIYQGSYPPGAIAGASPPAVAGHYTLMVIRVRHPAADRILVTDRIPASLNT